MDYNLFLQSFLWIVFISHNFVKLKLVILFSRLISFFLFSIEFMKNYKKLPIDPTPTTLGRCPLTKKRERERERERERGGYVGGGVCMFYFLDVVLGTFEKLLHIGRPWMNVYVQVLQKTAKKLESLFTEFNQISWILC